MKIILLFGWVRQQIMNCEEEGAKLSERQEGETSILLISQKNKEREESAVKTKGRP